MPHPHWNEFCMSERVKYFKNQIIKPEKIYSGNLTIMLLCFLYKMYTNLYEMTTITRMQTTIYKRVSSVSKHVVKILINQTSWNNRPSLFLIL